MPVLSMDLALELVGGEQNLTHGYFVYVLFSKGNIQGRLLSKI